MQDKYEPRLDKWEKLGYSLDYSRIFFDGIEWTINNEDNICIKFKYWTSANSPYNNFEIQKSKIGTEEILQLSTKEDLLLSEEKIRAEKYLPRLQKELLEQEINDVKFEYNKLKRKLKNLKVHLQKVNQDIDRTEWPIYQNIK